MPSNNDNSNDQKLGGLRSNGGLDSSEGGNRTHDKGNAHAAASDEVCDTGEKGNERNHGESGQLPSVEENQRTNRETGSTRGGSFEHYSERAESRIKKK